MLKLIKSESDIREILDMIPHKYKRHTILVRKDNKFVCGVYWSRQKKKWIFEFNRMYSFESDDERLIILLKDMEHEYEVTLLNSKDELIYEINNSNWSEVALDCLNNEGNIPLIINETKDDLGKPVRFVNQSCILLGVSSTMEDYYYYGLTSDRRLTFMSCVGKYEILKEDEVDDDLNNLMKDEKIDEIIVLIRHIHFMNNTEIEIIHL